MSCFARSGLVLAFAFLFGCSTVDSPDQETAYADEDAAFTAQESALLDLENDPLDPFQSADAKAIVFFFVRTDCPISNRYAPEIERLFRKYAPQRVAFWLVHPDPDASPAEIVNHAREYRLSPRLLRDPRHSLVGKTGVRVTPETAVFIPDGRMAYRGRIDNRYVDFGKTRPAATRHDLEEALVAILSGRPVANATTVAVGCYIPDLR